MSELEFDACEHISLCEALDRVLTKGAVVAGEVLISVANVDLIYLGLQLVLTSVASARAGAEASGLALEPAWRGVPAGARPDRVLWAGAEGREPPAYAETLSEVER